MPDEFYILSLKWSRGELLSWWRPNNSGYACRLDEAGRYTRAQVEGNPDYYNNGTNTLAIPCAEVEAASVRVVVDSNETLRKMTAKRFENIIDDDGPECDTCGGGAAPVRMGLRVVGDAS